MVMRRLCLVFFCSLALPLAAKAQSTLQPFNVTGTVQIGSASVPRDIDYCSGFALIDNLSGSSYQGATLNFSYDGDTASFSGVLQRDSETALEYTFTQAQYTTAPPICSYESQTRYYAENFGDFAAPASGDEPPINFERINLCSVVVNVTSTIAPDALSGMQTSFTNYTQEQNGRQDEIQGDFQGFGPDDTGATDPSLARGFLYASDGGTQTITGELLVKPDLDYTVSTIVTYADGSQVTIPLIDAFHVSADACPAVLNQTATEPSSFIQASFWLQRDPEDVDAGTGPSVTDYQGSFTGTLSNGTSYQYLYPEGDAPVNVNIKAAPDRYRAGSSGSEPTIYLSWPDGKSGYFYPPNGAGSGFWSPIVPITDNPQPAIGIWPDGDFFLLDQQTQSFSFQAPMAFIDGQVNISGCAAAADISSGQVYAIGVGTGDDMQYTAQDGNTYYATTGLEGAAFGGGMAPGGSYEVVGVPGAWAEYFYAFSLVHDAANPDATDYFNASVDFGIPYATQSPFTLSAGRAAALTESHQVELGQVHVAMRVLNDDGTLRPFTSPTATISSGATVSIDDGGTPASFSGSATGSSTAKLVHVLSLLSPPGTVDVTPSATVPALPDGGGDSNTTSFPVLHGLVVPPPTSGACLGVCIDALDGGTATDDGIAPTISIQLPAAAAAGSLSVSGTITDAKPIETLTVNGNEIPFTTTATGATFTLTSPLVDGANAFDIVAIDLCGEQGESKQTVTNSLQPTLDAIPAKSVAVGALLTITLVGHVVTGDTAVYSVDNLPAGAALNAATGVFTWSPTADEVAGSPYTLTFTVTDGALSASQMVAITVTPVDTPITFTATPAQTVTAGTLLTFTVHASDSAGDPITYSDTGAPAASTLGASTGVFTWTPGTADISATPASVTFIATHGSDTAQLVVPITVTAVADLGITIQAIPDTSVMVDVPISFTVTATDASGFTFTCAATGLPDGATFSGTTFNWTPTLTGSYTVTVTCTDTQGKSASATAKIAVAAKLKSDGCGCNETTPQPAFITLMGLVVYAWQRRRRARLG